MRRTVSLGVGGLATMVVGSLLFAACSGDGESERPDDTGGAGGTGPTGGSAGSGVTGGGGGMTGGSGGSAGSNTCKACMPTACGTDAPPANIINDFENLLIEPATPTFGIYNAADDMGMPILDPPWWEGYFAGTFAYPAIPEACEGLPDPMYPITRADASGELIVTGTVGTYSGFGIWLGQCMVDMSGSTGISFRIGGQTGSGMLKFSVQTNANQEPVMCLTGKGTCDLASAGACTPPSVMISVPETPAVVTVTWDELTGGSPSASVNTSEVLQLQWDFEWAEMMTPYEVNVTVDDVMMVE